MANKTFKEPYNIFYFLGFIAIILTSALPALLTWIHITYGYFGF